MKNTRNATPSTIPNQTIASSANATGLSEATIRRHIANGELRAYRIGRAIRIADSDLMALYTPVTPMYGVRND
ncbi:helix-turn-helix domain-containing protein [Brevibacterium zhoupengii]|uniref:helix-turn-helix domain-containing protein n=1 Tax=Brevibacterium zhoupengii TaxID=2898795 RepID=UPI0021D45B71|nr:helix-turn-helix domain-containing protein [Brevibacterium zhoupengii]